MTAKTTLTYRRKTLSTYAWAKLVGIHHTTILARVRRGWTDKAALTTPPSRGVGKRLPRAKPFECGVAAAREAQGLTRRGLMTRIGPDLSETSSSWLSDVEAGHNLRLETAMRIAEALGKTVEELWKRKEKA